MKTIKLLVLATVVCVMNTACFEDFDDTTVSTKDLNDFVWDGMNAFYLYKDDVPDLANDRFSSNDEYSNYLDLFSNPEHLFEGLIYQRESIDRFSWITDNYIALEQFFSGTTNNNGMEFGLVRSPQNSTELFGYVRYILPNSHAESLGIQRGQIFYGVDGTVLNDDNYRNLLGQNTYSINLATYGDNGTLETDDDVLIPETNSISLTKSSYSENPIFRTDILEVEGENVGYLMYNGFTANYNSQLNAVFGDFAANNVQHLVLDLRYNPGGSVNTSILLGSMITGNNGEIYSTEEWNSDIQTTLNQSSLVNRFTNNDNGSPLNTLNLNKVYILTTKSSASASELLINCLNPYIDVIHIGTTTTGKYQASITLYDSSDFRRQGANQSHTYAMQPLVLKSLNSVGFTDYNEGLDPDILLPENYGNLGVLGNPNETLLAVALQHIEDTNRTMFFAPTTILEQVGDSKDFVPFAKGMYTDKQLPSEYTDRLRNKK